MSSIVYGGLDVHRDSIVAHLIHTGTGEIVTDQVNNDRQQFLRATRRWSKLGELRLCYEASSAGFVVKRWLDDINIPCDVVAPSLIPRAPGDHVKTDKRDARKLAVLYRSGLLQAVRVPGLEEETVRAVLRLREHVTQDITRSKNRTIKYLRTLGQVYRQGNNWTKKYRARIASLALSQDQRLIVRTHLDQVDALVARQQAIARRIEEIAHSEPYWKKVQRLMSLRGIALHSAMVLIAEIGDARRFAKATCLMSYFGLVPRESSSGNSRHTGSITKAGNRRARWILTEAAWNQRGKPGQCRRLQKHWQTQPEEVVAIAKKAEQRLHHKFWKVGSRKDTKTAATAVAREMAGFVWALLTTD